MSLVLLSVSVAGTSIFVQSSDTDGRCDVDLVHGLSKGFEQIIEEEPCVDGDPMRLYQRGGVKYPFSFTAERQHASIAAAAAFVNTHPTTMPKTVGTVVIVIGGSTTSAHGAVKSCHVRADRDRTFTDYVLILAPTS